MSVKSTSSLRQLVVYLDSPDYDRLDKLRQKIAYKISMSSFAGSVLKQHADKAVRKSA